MCWLGDSDIGRSAKAVAEAERAERAAKTARLKSLRMATQLFLPETDLQGSFPEELDCSQLVAALTSRRSAGGSTVSPLALNHDPIFPNRLLAHKIAEGMA